MSAAPIDRLLTDLRTAFRSDRGARAAEGVARASRARIAELLSGYADECADWRDYALYGRACYTRNLIERCDEFELLLLCWDAGQRSPIHNHEGQDCWMTVLEGPIDELQFHFPVTARPGPPEQKGLSTFRRGQVAFIRDEIGLHEVRAPASARVASLHLYAKPYDVCNCYCEETGAVTRTQLAYDSIRGEPVDASS